MPGRIFIDTVFLFMYINEMFMCSAIIFFYIAFFNIILIQKKNNKSETHEMQFFSSATCSFVFLFYRRCEEVIYDSGFFLLHVERHLFRVLQLGSYLLTGFFMQNQYLLLVYCRFFSHRK
jgi:hypothetical protein